MLALRLVVLLAAYCGTVTLTTSAQVCHAGIRIFNESRTGVILDDVATITCNDSYFCATYQYMNRTASGTYFTQVGRCISPVELPYWTCDSLKHYTSDYDGTVGYCKASYCFNNDSYIPCSTTLISPPLTCPVPDENDLQLLPGCSAKSVLDSVFSCTGMALGSFPFNNSDICSSNVDSVVRCLSSRLQMCINQPCPSLLDEIYGFTDYVVPQLDRIVNGVESLSDLLRNIQEETGGNILGPININSTLICETILTNPQQVLNLLNQGLNLIPPSGLNLGSPICDNRIVDDLINWGVKALEGMLWATTRADICASFNEFDALLLDAANRRCNLDTVGDFFENFVPGFGGVIEKGIKLFIETWTSYDVPGCEGTPKPLVCYQGYNAFSADKSTFYEGNLTAQLCKPDQNCGFTTYLNTSDPLHPVYVESGFCIEKAAQRFVNCSGIAMSLNVNPTDFNNCTVDFCNSSTCNENLITRIPPSCSSSSDDIQLFPSCTLRQSLDGVFGCLGNYVGGYPYQDQGQCRYDVGNTIGCLSDKVQECLAGGCPTVLDAIPGVTQSYEMVISIASRIQSLESGLSMLPGNEGLAEMIYGLLCRSPDTTFVPSNLQYLLSQLEQLNFGNFSNPVCDQQVLPDVIKYAVSAVYSMLRARNHQDVCITFEQLKANLTYVWENRCDSSSLRDFLNRVVPEPYPALIMQGIDITLGFLSNLQIPNCDGVGPSPLSPPDCYQFYHSTSACGQRKAWVCDYVQWKYQIITDWLPRFLDYSEKNGIYTGDLPGCPADYPDMCTNYDQRRCAERLGCRACFCADNLYKDLGSLIYGWRHDYYSWQQIMTRYKSVLAQTEGGNTDDQC
ncbi:uncharacterized protein LOC143445263 [Clavelina lepadiformis]|uniref:uncharacterized protein LOC143445263 n=1 Tax=Clavelina lepadiformis TaxID=159417 RepID=UPI004041B32D